VLFGRAAILRAGSRAERRTVKSEFKKNLPTIILFVGLLAGLVLMFDSTEGVPEAKGDQCELPNPNIGQQTIMAVQEGIADAANTVVAENQANGLRASFFWVPLDDAGADLVIDEEGNAAASIEIMVTIHSGVSDEGNEELFRLLRALKEKESDDFLFLPALGVPEQKTIFVSGAADGFGFVQESAPIHI
jgi:hypothetical protein